MLEPQDRIRNAVIEGNLLIARRLITRFPDLWLNSDPNNNGWSNLHYASYYGHYLICFHLISYINNNLDGLKSQYNSLDLLSFDGLSVLHTCILNNHYQTLHYLLQEFPGTLWLNHPGGEFSRTPLQYSCVQGFEEGIKLLLEFGADWETQDSDGNTLLHLCFQFNKFECIQTFYKFLIMNSKEKSKIIQKIKQFELIQNNKGWIATEYTTSNDFMNKYKQMKKELFTMNFDFQESIPLTDISSSNSSSINLSSSANRSQTSLLENKVLASPIVPMSQSSLKDYNDTINTGTDNNATIPETQNQDTKGRAHSQSLPAVVMAAENASSGSSAKSVKAGSTRTRSNTYNYRPPNPISASPRAPHTPINQQAPTNKPPSLKSITISPSIRNPSIDEDNSNSNGNGAIPSSPVSTFSSSSSINMSPVHLPANRRKSSSFSKGSYQLSTVNNTSIEENDQWPTLITASPTKIIPQTIHVSTISSGITPSYIPPVQLPQQTRSDHKVLTKSKSISPEKVSGSSSTNSATSLSKSESGKTRSRTSSSASIAAKLAFNNNYNNNSPSSTSSLSSTSSHLHNGLPIHHSEIPRRGPSLSNNYSSSSVNRINFNARYEEPHTTTSSSSTASALRKTRSSGTLTSGHMENPNTRSIPSASTTAATLATSSSGSSTSTESSFRQNKINSISFSRVR
ncbi:hypothetical protein DFJ63DRAFT_216938 [Scheffersomyces coipomensis]|uniref:uncharacterized protein n=1 Tax=Scheffersomyces coipomensis TaxID=1788519 RepID=UPI00315CC211